MCVCVRVYVCLYFHPFGIWNHLYPFMVIRIIASSYDGHHIGLKIRRNSRGHPESLSFWGRAEGFNLTSKIVRTHPDFSLELPRRKDVSNFIYSFRIVRPKPSLVPLVSPALSPSALLHIPFALLIKSEFPGTFLHPCLCSNCFVLIDLGTLCSTCLLRPNITASALHVVFFDFSSLPEFSLLSTPQAGKVLPRKLRWFSARYHHYLYTCMISLLNLLWSIFTDPWCLAHSRI